MTATEVPPTKDPMRVLDRVGTGAPDADAQVVGAALGATGVERAPRRRRNLAERIASFMERRVDRRGVLRKGAMAGTALAVAPATFALRPGSAYAAVCARNALCNDGYTEFCCTITGANQCPPGTALGGWWKVDGSNFCGGGPRYYMDCNAGCGGCGCGANGICPGGCSGTPCGCANGDCNNRKAGCTGFRYGQCNQGIACLGPIVCRVVTCTEPWRLDGTCTTAARTDNATRYHSRPCLEVDAMGNVDSLTVVPGGVRVTGWAIDPTAVGVPISVNVYDCLRPQATVVANVWRDDIARSFPGQGQHTASTSSTACAPATGWSRSPPTTPPAGARTGSSTGWRGSTRTPAVTSTRWMAASAPSVPPGSSSAPTAASSRWTSSRTAGWSPASSPV